MEFYFNEDIDLPNIKDSMQLDSGTTIATLKYKNNWASLEVRGEVKVFFNPKVKEGEAPTDGDYYVYPSEFPQELKDLIAGETEIYRADGDIKGIEHNWAFDDRIYISENNWFELFVADDEDDPIPDAVVVDVEGECATEILNMLMGAINDRLNDDYVRTDSEGE